jgi:hypothetical protein
MTKHGKETETPNHVDEIVDNNVKETGLELLKIMNERYCHTLHLGEMMILERNYNHRGERELVALRKRDFLDRHEHETIMVRKLKASGEEWAPMSIAKYWLRWPHKNIRRASVFSPRPLSAEQEEEYFNLYTGFSREPAAGEFPLIDAHFLDIWCNGRQDHYHYLLTWLAHLLQRPWEKPGVALVIKGGKGTGKSTMFEAVLKPILGSLYCKIAHRENLSGRFNIHQLQKLLLVIEESFFYGDHQAEAIIKSLITEQLMLVEPKGVDAYEAETFMRLAFVSNEDHVVPASMDERRFFALEVSDAKAQDHEYFAALHQEIENGGLEAFMAHLMDWDIDMDLLRNPPFTETLFKDMLGGFSPFQRWAFELLNEDGDIRWGKPVRTATLYEHYKAWRENLHDCGVRMQANRIASVNALTQEVEKLFGFPRKKLDNVWQFVLPSRADARSVFAEKVHASIRWTDPDDLRNVCFDETQPEPQAPAEADLAGQRDEIWDLIRDDIDKQLH